MNGIVADGAISAGFVGKLSCDDGRKLAIPAPYTLFALGLSTFKLSEPWKKFAIYDRTCAIGMLGGAGFFKIVSILWKSERLKVISSQFLLNAYSVIWSTLSISLLA